MSRATASPPKPRAAAVWRRIVRWPFLVQRRLVYGFDLSAEPPRPAPRVPVSFSWEPAGSDGDEGFRGEWEGRTVYSMRVSTNDPEIRRLVPCAAFEPPAAFLYECETAPEARGLGVYPAALQAALGDLKARGARFAYIRVHRSNAPSIRGIEKAGFRLQGEVAHVTLLGRSLRPFAVRRARERAR